MPNYRTSASAAVMDARVSDIERSSVSAIVMRSGGFCLRGAMALATIFGRRPLDSIGIVAATAAIGAVVVNTLFLQVAPHPAPILAVKPRPVATSGITSSLPAAPPAARREDIAAIKADVPAATRPRAQIVSDIQRELSRRGFFDEPVDGVYGAKTDAAIRDFEQAAGIKGSAQPDDALLRLIARSTTHASPTVTAAVPTPTRASTPARTAPTSSADRGCARTCGNTGAHAYGRANARAATRAGDAGSVDIQQLTMSTAIQRNKLWAICGPFCSAKGRSTPMSRTRGQHALLQVYCNNWLPESSHARAANELKIAARLKAPLPRNSKKHAFPLAPSERGAWVSPGAALPQSGATHDVRAVFPDGPTQR